MLGLHIIYTYILLNFKINVNLAAILQINITITYPTVCPINVEYYNIMVASNVYYLGTFIGALCWPITFFVVTLTLIGFISIRKCKLTAKKYYFTIVLINLVCVLIRSFNNSFIPGIGYFNMFLQLNN